MTAVDTNKSSQPQTAISNHKSLIVAATIVAATINLVPNLSTNQVIVNSWRTFFSGKKIQYSSLTILYTGEVSKTACEVPPTCAPFYVKGNSD